MSYCLHCNANQSTYSVQRKIEQQTFVQTAKMDKVITKMIHIGSQITTVRFAKATLHFLEQRTQENIMKRDHSQLACGFGFQFMLVLQLCVTLTLLLQLFRVHLAG